MKDEENYKNKKSLIIYFSRAGENYGVGYIDKGNTEVVAEYVRDFTNADMLKIEPVNCYSADYDTCTKEARKRQISHDAPIVQGIKDVSSYEVIYIGSPVYWNDLPEELVTALKDVDFSGKVIRPFTTHEGSGLGNIPDQIKKICKGATVLEGLAVFGSKVGTLRSKVEEWI